MLLGIINIKGKLIGLEADDSNAIAIQHEWEVGHLVRENPMNREGYHLMGIIIENHCSAL